MKNQRNTSIREYIEVIDKIHIKHGLKKPKMGNITGYTITIYPRNEKIKK